MGSGQCKLMYRRELAAGGENQGANGGDGNQTHTLPQSAYAIMVEHCVIAHNGQVLGLGLRDQHAIKRIFVRAGELTGTDAMGSSD